MSDPTNKAEDTRIVRWVGEPARYLEKRLKGGKVEKVIDWDFERHREAPTPNHSVRIVRPQDLEGLSREYHWGPAKPFLAEMTSEDTQVLLESEDGPKFADVTEDAIVAKYADNVRYLDDPLHALNKRDRRSANGHNE